MRGLGLGLGLGLDYICEIAAIFVNNQKRISNKKATHPFHEALSIVRGIFQIIVKIISPVKMSKVKRILSVTTPKKSRKSNITVDGIIACIYLTKNSI